jgi:hypothetical protein
VNIPDRRGPAAGLCETCRNARVLTASNGGRFYLCALWTVDAAFPKYPRIPVLECKGYAANSGGASPGAAASGAIASNKPQRQP